jgi:hypothetical protein
MPNYPQLDPSALAKARGKAIREQPSKRKKCDRHEPNQARAPPDSDDEVAADDIVGFCRRYRLSPSMYFKLRTQGLTPRELRLGNKVIITRAAQQEWQIEREAETAEAKAAAVANKAGSSPATDTAAQTSTTTSTV